MAWTDNLRAASFRGVPFKVESHDMTAGRRTVTHEYPLRDKPFTEDMGRRAKGFTIDAYVIGDDYMSQRDRLLRACDEPGSAELVHPYLGTLSVVCTGISLRESAAEGRMARFSLSFVESGESEFPSDASDFVARAGLSADLAKGFSIDDFVSKFSIEGMPDFVVNDAISMFTTAADVIGGIAGLVNDIESGRIGFNVSGFTNSLLSMLGVPRELATATFGLFEAVTSLFESDDAGDDVSTGGSTVDSDYRATRALFPLYDFGSDLTPIKTTTATRRAQQRNRDAIIGLVRQAAVIQSARIAPRAEYETEDDATQVRETIADQIDAIAELPATSDDVFSSLQSLRTVVVEGVPQDRAELPNLVTLTPEQTTPSLVLAYDLYEDAARDADIVARNAIRHPGFLPGAQPLQVISDA
ncbi:MAG: DNA circularization protein [Novosphingobium sp.]